MWLYTTPRTMASGDSNAPGRAGARRRLASCMSNPCILLGLSVLLAIGHVVTAQEALPSTAPSLSSSPSFPTVSPSSHMPSQSPSSSSTLSAKPSISPSPSFSPTKTLNPSQSPGPTRTGTPSMTPVISPKISTADLFNIAMVLDGFPFINATNNVTSENRTLWETITSGHVATYWAKRNYTDFNITAITTNFQTQVSHFPEDDMSQDPQMTGTKVVYDQQIMYTVTGTDNPIFLGNETNQTFLFVRPFETDSQRYCDDLQKAFNIINPIFLVIFELIPFETPPPSPSSPPNGGGGGSDNDVGLSGGVVAAIVVACVAFVALALCSGLWCWTRRKEEHVKKDEYVGEPGAMVVVEEPPGFRQQDSEYSAPTTNHDPAASNSYVPEREETEDMDENDQRRNRQGSLHVGIPLDNEGHEGLLSDDDGYYSEEEIFAGSAVQQPSMVGFALQIHELEE